MPGTTKTGSARWQIERRRLLKSAAARLAGLGLAKRDFGCYSMGTEVTILFWGYLSCRVFHGPRPMPGTFCGSLWS